MKPGVKTIVAGAVFLLIAAAVIPLSVAIAIFHNNGHDGQFEVPGTNEISILKPGRYYLWNDFQTIYNGKSYSRSEGIPDGVEIRVHEKNGGPLQFTSDARISEKEGTESRNSIGYVNVGQPGTLMIEVSGNNEKRIFSFSQSKFLQTFLVILISLGFAFLAGIAGVIFVCWGIRKLTRAEKTVSNRPITLGGLPGS